MIVEVAYVLLMCVIVVFSYIVSDLYDNHRQKRCIMQKWMNKSKRWYFERQQQREQERKQMRHDIAQSRASNQDGLAPKSNQALTGSSVITPPPVPIRHSTPPRATIPISTPNGTACPVGSMPDMPYPMSLPSDPALLQSNREVESLKNEVHLLRKELARCRDTIARLQEREKMVTERLSEQVQKDFEKGSTHFEDLNLGDNRPTQLIRRYGNLYSETRLDAFDALDELPDIREFDELKGKLLFSVIVLSFRSVQQSLYQLRGKLRHLLFLPVPDSRTQHQADPIAKELEDTISVYLRKSIQRCDISTNVEEVSNQVWATLYDYPSLKECDGLQTYIVECIRLAWAVSVQNPPLTVDFDSKVFKADMHTRFHTSDPDSDEIKSVLWPALLEDENGSCVHKGVVIT